MKQPMRQKRPDELTLFWEDLARQAQLVKECASWADALDLDEEARHTLKAQFPKGDHVDWQAVLAHLQQEAQAQGVRPLTIEEQRKICATCRQPLGETFVAYSEQFSNRRYHDEFCRHADMFSQFCPKCRCCCDGEETCPNPKCGFAHLATWKELRASFEGQMPTGHDPECACMLCLTALEVQDQRITAITEDRSSEHYGRTFFGQASGHGQVYD